MTQVWLITGSSRGLGRAIAEAVLDAGHRLVATARNPRDLDDLVSRYGDRVRSVALDVRDSEHAKAAVATAVREFGRLDVVVNNAGAGRVTSIEECSEADFRDQLEINLMGPVTVTKAALPVLHKQRSGHFIQIGSSAGHMAFGGGLAPYVMAKFALRGFTESLAAECAPFGVKATIVELGGFQTDWTGPSLVVTEPGPDYVASVGALLGVMRGSHGNMPGDPALAARVLLDVAAMDEPPLSLLLGSDAVDMVRLADQARNAEIDKWEHVSRSTDREPESV
ncbi:NADP-dependent 3-hydroxy acid dehydrogenase YdfG [Lentzea fradiae]|uniref:NADP-dependent 3-hydroxy acid dehydrogenase YdfG n=1 Tax=Lentzea fradiae TaxID=200378 RepID=A0A1G7PRN1_9PSEU|nr:SDR family NAD(P)-dependent oxidoreductase [Lentzea fradiae]SDF88885.1 NADP-dependent 3-hydroxy acid dehydrogenase YdfG [Lentzea fradiae]